MGGNILYYFPPCFIHTTVNKFKKSVTLDQKLIVIFLAEIEEMLARIEILGG